MAFSESLAARLRDALARKKNIAERKMFGCICILLHGNAMAGVWKDRLIARLGPDEGEAALREPHVKRNASMVNLRGRSCPSPSAGDVPVSCGVGNREYMACCHGSFRRISRSAWVRNGNRKG